MTAVVYSLPFPTNGSVLDGQFHTMMLSSKIPTTKHYNLRLHLQDSIGDLARFSTQVVPSPLSVIKTKSHQFTAMLATRSFEKLGRKQPCPRFTMDDEFEDEVKMPPTRHNNQSQKDVTTWAELQPYIRNPTSLPRPSVTCAICKVYPLQILDISHVTQNRARPYEFATLLRCGHIVGNRCMEQHVTAFYASLSLEKGRRLKKGRAPGPPCPVCDIELCFEECRCMMHGISLPGEDGSWKGVEIPLTIAVTGVIPKACGNCV